MKDGFIKVAAAAPSLHLADCSYNAARIAEAAEQAADILIYSRDLTLKESQVWAVLGHLK